jgi:RNase P subunit RPR2
LYRLLFPSHDRMRNDLRTNTCPKCKAISEQVLNMETRLRVGWYCLECHYFEKAILRETVIHKKGEEHAV